MTAIDRKAAFIKFHKDNPDVWRVFRDRTRRLIKNGHKHFSQRMIWETMRMDAIMLGTVRKPMKSLFLGQCVKTVLNEASCAVAVYVL